MAAILSAFFVFPACYTLLKHPTVIEEDYQQEEASNCYSCHDESDLWGFHHPRERFIPGAAFYDPWVYYYDVPWWYESYWFYDDPNRLETIPLHSRSLRSSEDKRRTLKIRGDYERPSHDMKIKGQNLKSKDKIKGKEDSKSKKKKKRSLRGKWKKEREKADANKKNKESSPKKDKNKTEN